ncbi:6-hydroxymethylpterin diphosphokinase MptE-like protein [Candidatus Hodarchaeum mangrovi]
MDLRNWEKNYSKIVKQLNLDKEADINASNKLENYLMDLSPDKKEKITKTLKLILQKPIIIAGAGPSLETDFDNFFQINKHKYVNFISVDGSTALFHQKNVFPTIIITDLDGDLKSIEWGIKNGSIVLIHAHGDNLTRVSRFFKINSQIIKQNNVWGTTQSKSSHILFNFGGFTDGDRAIFLAFYFQSPLIGLIGFDFGNKIGKYSKYKSPIKKSLEKKKIKFQIALDLISSYHSHHKGIRYNLTTQGVEITGFPRIEFQDFLNQLDQFRK